MGGVGAGTIAMPWPAARPGIRLALPPPRSSLGSVALDPDRREVTVGGSPHRTDSPRVRRPPPAYGTCRHRAHTAGIARALGYEYVGDTNNVDVHIAHLRAKIEDAGGVHILQTVRGVGYVCRA